MLERPPRESERRSWTYAILWAGLIFVTIPFVRMAASYVRDQWGGELFTYGVTLIAVLVAAGALFGAWKRLSLVSLAWIVGLCALVIYLSFDLSEGSPEEAIHYVQYGVLSVLLFRVLAHRVHDHSIYFAATLAGSLVGMLDETIQWLAPGRTFSLRDIWLNFTAVALVQLGLAFGIRPGFISRWPGWASLRRVSYLAAVAVAYLGLCYQNTPDRIAWYTERVPLLGFIDPDVDIMVEYGHLHGHADAVQFRSRLSLEDLRRQARERAQEGARILDRYREHERYGEFLATYSPLSDPFLHEARVHLFRRDVHLERATSADVGGAQGMHFAIAYWENRILERYFGDLLRASSYRWPAELAVEVRSAAQADWVDDSWVSRHLIVGINREQLAWLFLLATASFLVVGHYCSRRAMPKDDDRRRRASMLGILLGRQEKKQRQKGPK